MNAYRASAPVRLDFAGAWTDVAPFAAEERGVVVNAAIELRAHAEVIRGGSRYCVRSDDLDRECDAPGPGDLPRGGPLDLLCAALRRSDAGPAALRTWSDAPAGAGLGGSGALGVAIVAAMHAARGERPTATDVAAEAWQLETMDAARPGGKQDQYAAALGGFNHLTFTADRVTARRLRLDEAFADELERHTIVCYTGQSRLSSDTITRVMTAYSRQQGRVVGALRALVEIAEKMAEAIERADLAHVGALLAANWRQQQLLDDGMRTAEMARLEAAMLRSGAIGGKAAGAGAGGSMFFVVRDRDAAAAAALDCGAVVLSTRWAQRGVLVE